MSENRPEDKTLKLQVRRKARVLPLPHTAASGGCVCDSQVREYEHRVGGWASQRFELDLCRLHQPHAVLVEDLVTCIVIVCYMRRSTCQNRRRSGVQDERDCN